MTAGSRVVDVVFGTQFMGQHLHSGPAGGQQRNGYNWHYYL
jgi:hypothetical protein